MTEGKRVMGGGERGELRATGQTTQGLADVVRVWTLGKCETLEGF